MLTRPLNLSHMMLGPLLVVLLSAGAVFGSAPPAGAFSKYTKCRWRVAQAYYSHGYGHEDLHTHQFNSDVWTLCGDLYHPGERW